MKNIKIIESPEFQNLQNAYDTVFISSFGDEVNSYRLLKTTSNSNLFELTLTEGGKHQRLVIGTYDELPSSIDLTDYNEYFEKTPALDQGKSIQIIQFDSDQKPIENKCYGSNPNLFNITSK